MKFLTELTIVAGALDSNSNAELLVQFEPLGFNRTLAPGEFVTVKVTDPLDENIRIAYGDGLLEITAPGLVHLQDSEGQIIEW